MDATTQDSPLFLSASALARLLTPRACRDALAQAYADLAEDPDCAAQSVAFALADGSIHVKASVAPKTHDCFAAKINVNLPGNPMRGLPTIQGLVVLMDARTGAPLAVMDSAELTARRTAAATALAATFGARVDSRRAALIGCGKQAGYQAEALMDALPGLKHWRLFDLDAARAAALVEELRRGGGVAAEMVGSLEDAVRDADVCITCTTATAPYLAPRHLRAGCFVAGVGADNPAKSEIAPECFAGARILTDDLDQAFAYGDLAHAMQAGTASRESVHATLADLASGRRQGRASVAETVIFDSTGSGLQDLAAAKVAYRLAAASERPITMR